MGKDLDEGRRKQVAGSVKELIGKLIGNKHIEDEGAREKAGLSDPLGVGGFPNPLPDKTD